MPRDASGNFTLVSGNPVVSGTIITSDWANTTMPDLALGLQDSLDRFGRGGMEVPFKVPDGSGVAPGYAFVNEPSLGFYRAGAGQLGVAVGGAGRLFLSSTLWDSIVPMRLNAQNAGTQLTIKQGSAQTEAILRVISNDELTEYLAIDNAGQVTIDDLVVSNTPTIPGYATLGANTFTNDQTIEQATGVASLNIDCDSPTGFTEVAFKDGGVPIAYVNVANSSQVLQVSNVSGGSTVAALNLTSSGLVNVSPGTLQQGGVNVATVGANTFTATQTITNPGAQSLLSINSVAGQRARVDLKEAGVNSLSVLNETALSEVAIIKFESDGATQACNISLTEDGSVDVRTGQIKQGGVNVATVNTNWLLSDITDVTATATEVNYTDGVTSAIQPQLNSKAPLASPALTGTPTAPTAAAGTNTTQLATTAFVQGSLPSFSATVTSEAMTSPEILTVDTTNFTGLAEDWDDSGWFTPSTGRFQPNIAGKYRLTIHSVSIVDSTLQVYLFKNTFSIASDASIASGSFYYANASILCELNGSTDYAQFKVDSGADASWTMSSLTIQAERVGS